MANNLVILESPGKIGAVKSYLGSNYKVIASIGHVRDLPKSTLGIDTDNGFEPHYINIRGKGDLIKELKKEAKNADKIFFATDPDREGEAISWHLAAILGDDAKKAKRISFNEIDAVFYFRSTDSEREPLESETNLFRLCDVHNIPLATNIATAEALIMALDSGSLNWREFINPRSAYNMKKRGQI